MGDFTFLTYDPGTTTQTPEFNKIVRSKAARAGAPTSRPPAQAGTVTAVSVVAHASQELRKSQRRALRPIFSRSSTSKSSTTRTSNAASEGSSEAIPPATTPSTGSWTSMILEPKHPVLMGQPLLSEAFSPLFTSFYLQYMAVDITDLDQGYPGSLRSTWFPFVITSEGMLETVLLIAGSCYLNQNIALQADHGDVRPTLVSLRQKALVSIRRMIMDDSVRNTDQTLGAVIKMASFECMYGTQEAYDFHMKALRKLVDARGGLSQLGVNGILERMICWIDYNAACLMNTSTYFPEGNALPKPLVFDPSAFIGGSDQTNFTLLDDDAAQLDEAVYS